MVQVQYLSSLMIYHIEGISFYQMDHRNSRNIYSSQGIFFMIKDLQ